MTTTPSTTTPLTIHPRLLGLLVAILPVAYSDGTGGLPCDLCAADIAIKPTSRLAARLATDSDTRSSGCSSVAINAVMTASVMTTPR